ncbi:MAG: CDP-diacylglycerol--glycerol-3-phosphate 3-phosphatidyltransferase [Candidatus Omnitrophota bacterium]
MYFVFARWTAARYLAFITFAIACWTDYYDGYVARREKQITNFGKLMDPIADKILLLAAFLAFVELKLVPAWTVVVIVAREVTITGLRIFALGRGTVLQAEEAGKHKTVSQMIAIFTILTFLILKDTAKFFLFWSGTIERWFLDLIFVLMVITVVLTLSSGISFLLRNRRMFA